jgi:hypothetical protein
MGIPKRKNNIDVYGSSKESYQGEKVLARRQELLDRITKSDAYLPDSILHDDLDSGMLDFIKTNFIVVSDGSQIPIIPKILTYHQNKHHNDYFILILINFHIKFSFILIYFWPFILFFYVHYIY